MMKNLLCIIFIGLGFFSVNAQTVLFQEDFETLPITMVTSTTSPGDNWAVNSNYSVSGTKCDSAKVSLGDTLVIETPAFNTTGFAFISLEFNQICKIDFFDKAYIEYSLNNGASWIRFPSNSYNGAGLYNGNAFSSISYTDWNPGNVSAIPTSSWWKSESFNMSATANNNQVKVRFMLIDADNNGARNNYGWLLDDVKITGSSCELVPPSITQVGTVYQGTVYGTGPYNIEADIQDASGVASAVLEYSVNNGAINTINMNIVSGTVYRATIPMQFVGDMVCYTIKATDNTTCGNMAALPSSGCTQFSVNPNAPPSCNGTPVNSFNYSEDFSSFTPGAGRNPGGAGTLANNWTNAAGSTHEWWVYDQATMSTLTGPSSDHSLNDQNYLYVEASGFSNQTATLLSPCYDFSGLSAPKFSFWYHMWGSNMGQLHIDLINGTNLIQDIVPPIIGDQGNQWLFKEIDLSTYAGNIIQIRFRGITGGSFRSDIAIDDIEINEPIADELTITSFVTPTSGGCSGSANEIVTVNIANLGNADQDTIPLAYRVNNGSVVRDTAFFNLMVGSNFNHTFQQTFNMTMPGNYNLDAWLELPTDGNMSNDSILNYTVTNNSISSILPDTTSLDNFTVGNPGVFMDGWSNSAGNVFDWRVNSGITTTSFTGPTGDTSSTTGNGNYIYYEASNLTMGESGSISSGCFDISNTNRPELKFYYHMWGSNMGELHLDVSINGFIVQDIIPVISGNQGNLWKEKVVDLTPYKGVLKLIFRAVRGNGDRSDIAIDQVLLRDAQPLGVTENTTLQGLTLYPNPVSDRLSIETEEQTEMIVYDIIGAKLLEKNLKSGFNQVETDDWKAGVYFITFRTSHGQVTRRIVKN